MLNLEQIEKEYQKYRAWSDYLGELEEKLSNYKIEHIADLAYLLPIYDRLKRTDDNEFYAKHSEKLAPIFLEKNPTLQEWKKLEDKITNTKRALIGVMEEPIVQPYQRFIALKQDEKSAYSYDLLELYTQEKIDLGQFDEEKVEFIINLLRSASCFIGYANKRDLPLLMNLLDECDREFDYSSMDIADVAEESYLAEESCCHDMELQLIRAHMNDSHLTIIKDKVYNRLRSIKQTYFTKDQIDKMFEKLESKKDTLSEKEYKIEYYTILMLNNNIEQLYLKVPDEDREVVLDAYMNLSQGVEVNDEINPIQYRTASPLINIEVLKRKEFIKRKGK